MSLLHAELPELIRRFDQVVRMPGGVDQVRALVLDACVTGALGSPTSPSGADAVEGPPTSNRATPGGVDEKPFEVPVGWAWRELGEVARFIDYRGRTPKKTVDGVPLITAKNVRMGRLRREPREFIASEDYAGWMTRGFPEAGDVLFTTEAPLANVCVLNIAEPIALAQRIICLHPNDDVLGSFLAYVLMAPLFQKLILERATGTTVSGIRSAQLKLIPVPIPPRADQARIVELVQGLFRRLDLLEAESREAEEERAGLARSTFEKLGSNFDFALSHLELLLRTKSDVDSFELSLIRLGTSGGLLFHEFADGTGSDLSPPTPRAGIASELRSDAVIPEHWAPRRIGDLLSLEYGKGLSAAERDERGLYPVYGANGVLARSNSWLVEDDAVVVGRKGSAGAMNVVSGRFWPSDVTFYVSSSSAPLLNFRYLYYLLRSVDMPSLAGGIKPGLNRNDVYSIVVGLPPCLEQERIAAYLDGQLAKLGALRALVIRTF